MMVLPTIATSTYIYSIYIHHFLLLFLPGPWWIRILIHFPSGSGSRIEKFEGKKCKENYSNEGESAALLFTHFRQHSIQYHPPDPHHFRQHSIQYHLPDPHHLVCSWIPHCSVTSVQINYPYLLFNISLLNSFYFSNTYSIHQPCSHFNLHSVLSIIFFLSYSVHSWSTSVRKCLFLLLFLIFFSPHYLGACLLYNTYSWSNLYCFSNCLSYIVFISSPAAVF